MSNTKDVIETTGIIKESYRGGLFKVDVVFGEETLSLLAKTSGKMKKFGIRLNLGDSVKVEISPYDLTKGRITYRI